MYIIQTYTLDRFSERDQELSSYGGYNKIEGAKKALRINGWKNQIWEKDKRFYPENVGSCIRVMKDSRHDGQKIDPDDSYTLLGAKIILIKPLPASGRKRKKS